MSNSKEEQYREIFLAEALENQQELDKRFIELENDHGQKGAIEAIFRILHTLKGNAQGMGFKDIASLAHTMEDMFSEIRAGKIELTNDLFNDVFKANDVLGRLIAKIKDPGKRVSWRGIKTKLEVFLRKQREAEAEDNATETAPQPEAEAATETETTSDSKDLEFDLPEKPIEFLEDPEEEANGAASEITFSDVIQIPVAKLDELMNLVGELIIERDRVISISEERDTSIIGELAMLQRITSELQYSVMDARLVQAEFLFDKFHRIVRDAATSENKKVRLKLVGAKQEIDRNVLQTISDSLIHLVRNAIGHGIESAEERKKAGKDPVGTVTLTARNEQDNVVIEVRDDGKGIDANVIRRKAVEKNLLTSQMAASLTDQEAIQLIFEAGFSSAEAITSISGRGVGMDVVKKAIDTIGGKVRLETEVGKGTTVILDLPTTMAVKGALLFVVSGAEFAIPLTYTESVVSFQKHEIHKVSGGLIATYLDKTLSIVFLRDLLAIDREQMALGIPDKALHHSYDRLDPEEEIKVIIVSYGNRGIGFVVDRLLQQKEIVEKPLEKPLDAVRYLSGVTILGNGNVCLVLDVAAVSDMLFRSKIAAAEATA